MSNPEMEPVDSEAIEAIGYNAALRELAVRYTGGRTYIYLGVEPEVYAAFRDAESRGTYVNREIKPRYAFRPA
jgi:hypothetical protein